MRSGFDEAVTRRDVHGVAFDVVMFHHHPAHVEAHPKGKGLLGVTSGGLRMKLHLARRARRVLRGVKHAHELVTHGLDDPSAATGDDFPERSEQPVPQGKGGLVADPGSQIGPA
jgi:hypothetical protein